MYNFKNINLKRIELDDLQTLLDLKATTWNTTHSVTMNNIEQQRRWYDSIKSNEYYMKAIQDSKWIGMFKVNNINSIDRTGDVGWDVLEEFRGQKLSLPIIQCGVDFCFNLLNLNRLNCEILENNPASIKSAEKAGFKKEGCKRQAVYRSGKYIDSYVYGLLRNEVGDEGLEPPTSAV